MYVGRTLKVIAPFFLTYVHSYVHMRTIQQVLIGLRLGELNLSRYNTSMIPIHIPIHIPILRCVCS